MIGLKTIPEICGKHKASRDSGYFCSRLGGKSFPGAQNSKQTETLAALVLNGVIAFCILVLKVLRPGRYWTGWFWPSSPMLALERLLLYTVTPFSVML